MKLKKKKVKPKKKCKINQRLIKLNCVTQKYFKQKWYETAKIIKFE